MIIVSNVKNKEWRFLMSSIDFENNKSIKSKIWVVLALAVPAMIENILQTAVGFVDTLFIARIGLDEVTAVGIANAIFAIYLALFMALGVGASSLVSRNIGAKDLQKANRAAQNAIKLATWLAVATGVFTLLGAEWLMSLFGANEGISEIGGLYLRIVGGASVFMAWMTVFGSILRAAGDTKSPMNVALVINILHIPLDYLMIFGIGDWEGWGVAGAAWATVIVRLLGTVFLLWYLKRAGFAVLKDATSKDKNAMKEIVNLTIPAAIERLIMRLGQVVYFGLIVAIGAKVFASHTIAGNIEMFSYMPGYALAVAATTLVGQAWGSSKWKEAHQYGLITVALGMVFMSIVGVVLFIWAPWFASWFTDDREAIEMVTIALRIDAFAQPALAAGLILTGALQGIGDTKSPMYSTAVGMWGIRILGILLLSIYWDLGIAGVWIAIAVDITVRAIYLYSRYKKHFQHVL